MVIRYEVVSSCPVEAVVALYQSGGWWREDPYAREIIPRMVRGSFCFLTAVDAGGRIVGMGRAVSDGASDAYIQDVVVLTEYRRRGIGQELIRRLVAHCRERGLEWIGLVAEPGTTPFYEKLGFEVLPGHVALRHR